MRLGRLAVVGLLLAFASSTPRVAAQDAPPSQSADIRAGNCSEPGDAVAALNPLIVPEGESQGPNGATPVAQSVTDISLMVPDLLSATNSLMVYTSPDQTGAPLVCGEIGGVVGADGSLTIGLQAMNGGNVSGVATFAPTRKDDGTTVSVNLVDDPSGHGGSDGGADGANDGGGGGGRGGNGGGGGKSGGDGASDGASPSDGAGAPAPAGASDGAGASGGTDAAPLDPSQEDAINAIAALNPNIAPPPGASHQPGGSGMVDFPGRENRADRRGNGGKGEAASAGADGNASN